MSTAGLTLPSSGEGALVGNESTNRGGGSLSARSVLLNAGTHEWGMGNREGVLLSQRENWRKCRQTPFPAPTEIFSNERKLLRKIIKTLDPILEN